MVVVWLSNTVLAYFFFFGFKSSTAVPATTSSVTAPQRLSKVVHLRNIPSDMTEIELIHFCMPYGKLVNYLMLKGKNQAFVEYEDEQGAQALVTVSATCPIAIRDRTIFCQFSTHQELKTDKLRSSTSSSLGTTATAAATTATSSTNDVDLASEVS
ncbi:unnamed protein product [Enterobius vermicularis]|uniref:RRM domain-containing protein n=1 Tax=Enterobius vermicularis TaxID=51028 RepID=A0A0N4VLG2_ENTVE|nr:unnamed protein product [Enterobius vermicularis]